MNRVHKEEQIRGFLTDAQRACEVNLDKRKDLRLRQECDEWVAIYEQFMQVVDPEFAWDENVQGWRYATSGQYFE